VTDIRNEFSCKHISSRHGCSADKAANEDRRTPMNAHSTHKSAIWLSVVILLLLSAAAVFADESRGYPPKIPYRPEPIPTRSPVPTPTREVTPDPKPSDTPVIVRPSTPTPPPRPGLLPTWLWWISATILVLLLLFFLYWILRRPKRTGYATPPGTPAAPPSYPPVDQSRQQKRPDQY
jgi:hypothetical protein